MPAPHALSYLRAWLAALCAGLSAVALLPALPGRAAALACLAGGFACALRRSVAGVATAGFALGFGWAMIHGQEQLARRLPEDCLRVPVAVQGVVASLPRVSELVGGGVRQRFELAVTAIQPARCAKPQHLLMSAYDVGTVRVGEGWAFHGHLRRPWGLENPGSFNMQAWFAVSGIDALGSAGRAWRLPQLDAPWRFAHQRLRQHLAQRIAQAGLSATGHAVISAITIADKRAIDRQMWETLQAWGLNHLLVVSGLHVGMLAATVILLSQGLRRACHRVAVPDRVGLGMALAAAASYTALAGFSVATTRALIMLAAFILCSAIGRHARGASALLPALALILLANPLAAVSSGLWLSFTAVASLLWLSVWQVRSNGAWLAWRAHLFLALVMLPLGALFFGGSSLLSAPANLLAVPLFAFWVVPLALLGVVLSLCGSGLDAGCWQLAAAPVEPGLAAIEQVQHYYLHLAAQPLSIALASLALLSLAAPLSPWVRGLAAVLMLPLLLPAGADDSAVRVTVLDVGQGTAVVVRKGRRALLYDTGGGDPAGANMARSVVLPFLRSRGLGALQDLVISHGDQDHAAGLDSVRSALPVRRLWMGGIHAAPPEARPCTAGQAWHWPGGPRFQFLSPGSGSALSSNDASCVLTIDTGYRRILLAGDISRTQEFELLRYWQAAVAADVLLVGHHGSQSSTAQAWLNRVAPATAIYSVGYGNRFGHPHASVQARVTGQGVRQYLSWEHGAVELVFTGPAEPAVRSHRDAAKSWWK